MKITKILNGIVLKKLIKIAGYQGKESVHTRTMQKFISLIKNEFSISFIEDITSNNKKSIGSYKHKLKMVKLIFLSFYKLFYQPNTELLYLDLPFYFNSKEELYDLNKNLKPDK